MTDDSVAILESFQNDIGRRILRLSKSLSSQVTLQLRSITYRIFYHKLNLLHRVSGVARVVEKGQLPPPPPPPPRFQGERVGGRAICHVVTLGTRKHGKVLTTATGEHRAAERSNAEIAM